MTAARIAALALALTATLEAAPASAAEPDRDLAKCAAISGSVERLACFDALAKQRGAVATSKPVKSKGQWRARTSTSKIDDSKSVFLSVDSMQKLYKALGASTPTLWIRCLENTTSIYVDAKQYVTTQDVPVTYRIDKQKAETREFFISTDHEAFGLWRGGSAIPFIKRLFGRDTLLVQFTPYGESAATLEFPITGLEESIGPLAEACHWTP